ncbi:MAG TPA: GNAT family N-acetyltransferase [Marmoricola sp.]|jgi:GNAT superfamily N-acetyltransferase|nr:GNAT family N-acetyltransferase [Marmoricola sp.]
MLPLGWHTDIAVLRRTGSLIEEAPDHLVVRTPDNPLYHWGNFVLVTDPRAVGDAQRWLDVFESEFPDAAHRSVGLVAEPPDPEAWTSHGLAVEHDDVLVTDTCPDRTPVPQGYLVKQLADAVEWEQSNGLRIAEFAADDAREAQFERTTTDARIAMSRAGHTAWFGAFHGDQLAAELGIVDCGDGVARYQAVVTDEEHRRRGLASHLLGVAAAWAEQRGAGTWVILAEVDGGAGRLYRARGFVPTARGTRAYLKPPPG